MREEDRCAERLVDYKHACSFLSTPCFTFLQLEESSSINYHGGEFGAFEQGTQLTSIETGLLFTDGGGSQVF